MDPVIILLIVLIVINLALFIILAVLNRKNLLTIRDLTVKQGELTALISRLEKYLMDDLRQNREETMRLSRENREELGKTLSDFRK